MDRLRMLAIKRELIKYAANDEMKILRASDTEFHAESIYSGIDIELEWVSELMSRGYTIEEIIGNEGYSMEEAV